MTLKEQLAEKKAELVALKDGIEAGDVEAIKAGEEITGAIAEINAAIESAKKAQDILASIGEETETDIDTEGKNMSTMEEFTNSAKSVDRSVKGWNVAQHFKSSSDVVTGVTIADVDRSVAPVADRVSAASLFTQLTISGNAITYFKRGAYEGTPAITAENNKKTQNSTSFTGTTLALSKIAAYIKETDEIVADAPFLSSTVENSLINELGLIEDKLVIDSISGTSGILSGTYGENGMADGILGAIKAIKGASAYDASAVIINPADMLALMTTKDQNGQYIGGGYFAGAYGNGNYSMPTNVWGIPVFESAKISQGTVIVAAKQAVKVWRKGGLDVKLYEQNEDDALYNRVTLLAEERAACAVVDVNGVYKLTSSASV